MNEERESDRERGAVTAAELAEFLDELLGASRFVDYCPNGLQVEGDRPIACIASGVTASAAFVREATLRGADALLVHHGWFWRGDDPRPVGAHRERLRLVLSAGAHLFAYHLPLDAHPSLGNNAQLGNAMGWRIDGSTGEHGLIVWHDLEESTSSEALVEQLAARLNRRPLAVGALDRPIRRIAWCTGAAHDWLDRAIAAGADAFVSGEIAERTTHLAREAGVVYVAAGHHATERFGIQSLGRHVAEHFQLQHFFVDDDNPV